MDSEQLKQAKQALAEEQKKLQTLYDAQQKQQGIIEGLQQKGKLNLAEVSLTQLLNAGTQSEADTKELSAATAIAREIGRRIEIQKEAVRKAEVRTRIDEAQALSAEAWQLENEIAEVLPMILKNFDRIFRINQDIYAMIDRSRQMAFNANPFSRLDTALEQFNDHRKQYKQSEDALNTHGL